MTSSQPSQEGDDMDKVLSSYFDKTVNSNTIKEKPLPSNELSKSDLLKILSYLEGEVQARDVVIATLKCERVKRLLADGKYTVSNNPFAALRRDNCAAYINTSDLKEDVELLKLWENQQISVENLIRKQRQAMRNLSKILTDSEHLHSQAVKELEEEKAKNLLNKDGSNLRGELEIEKQLRARLEKELKEAQDAHEDDKAKHKSIVLLLLTERKKIIRQFIEERKRSADLSAMLEEEKRQALTMAEGLEEESQKALRMESELERQTNVFMVEQSRMADIIRREEQRRTELEKQYKTLLTESEALRKQLAEAHSVAMFQASLNNPSNTIVKKGSTLQTTMVRPTATVNSVPVSQPTTGVAKSVTPIQQIPVATPHVGIPTVQASSSEKTGSLIPPKKYNLSRVPPPVPPNKPINKPAVPPKSGITAKIHAAKLEQQIT